MRPTTLARIRALIEGDDLGSMEVLALVESIAGVDGFRHASAAMDVARWVLESDSLALIRESDVREWIVGSGIMDANDYRDEVVSLMEADGAEITYTWQPEVGDGSERRARYLDALGVKVEAMAGGDPEYDSDGYVWLKVWANDLDQLRHVS